MNPAIEIRSLTKRFGEVRGVDSLDLTVAPGEVYGLLGPNGAGKTTTIRVLMGYLTPTGGSARGLGGDLRDPALRRRTGYLPGDAALDKRLTVDRLLHWYAAMRGGGSGERIGALCERLSLDRSRRIGELSTGNRRKLGIVQALMHAPDLLVLDEATAGLDPLVQREVLSLVRERCDAGAGVLFSSHVLPEVEDIADRVGMLRRGRLVHEAPVHGLRDLARQRYELRFPADVPAGAFRGVTGVTAVEVDGATVRAVVDGAVRPLLERAVRLDVQRVTSHAEDLEDIFFHYYRDAEARDEESAAPGEAS